MDNVQPFTSEEMREQVEDTLCVLSMLYRVYKHKGLFLETFIIDMVARQVMQAFRTSELQEYPFDQFWQELIGQ